MKRKYPKRLKKTQTHEFSQEFWLNNQQEIEENVLNSLKKNNTSSKKH